MVISTLLLMLIKNIYTLWVRRCLLLPVTYIPSNTIYPFTYFLSNGYNKKHRYKYKIAAVKAPSRVRHKQRQRRQQKRRRRRQRCRVQYALDRCCCCSKCRGCAADSCRDGKSNVSVSFDCCLFLSFSLSVLLSLSMPGPEFWQHTQKKNNTHKKNQRL